MEATVVLKAMEDTQIQGSNEKTGTVGNQDKTKSAAAHGGPSGNLRSAGAVKAAQVKDSTPKPVPKTQTSTLAQGSTRAQAEATYCKTLDECNRILESLEKALTGANNIRGDIRSSFYELSRSFRDFHKIAKTLGMTRSLDTVEQQLKQQQQQQLKTIGMLKEIQVAQQQCQSCHGDMTTKGQPEISSGLEKGIRDINARIDTYEGKVDKLLKAYSKTEETTLGAWSEVVKKSKNTTQQRPGPARTIVDKNPSGRIGTRRKNRAIIVDSKPDEFPALIKKLSKEVDQQAIGDRVVGMRQTRKGGMLIEIDGDLEEVEAVKAEVTKAAGKEMNVRTVAQKGLMEIRDIADWSVKEDILNALVNYPGLSLPDVNVLSIRKIYRGSLAAMVLLPLNIAEKIVAAGRIKIGMVCCKVRLCERLTRCFRCMVGGHEARNCPGPNREKCCRKCGCDGHFAAQCTAEQEAVVAFRNILLKEAKGSQGTEAAAGSRGYNGEKIGNKEYAAGNGVQPSQ